jgi:general secretion pathway protein G
MRDTRRHLSAPDNQAGLTLLELIMACAILLVLASAAIPLARFTVKREKEAELRRDLREMRNAVDSYKDAADRHLIRVEAGTEGYPPDLETLVQGVDLVGQSGPETSAGTVAGQSALPAPQFGSTQDETTNGAGATAIRHVRFLRRIPVDPMTGQATWGLRAVQDPPDSKSWGGKDIFDVYSLSNGTALDSTQYSDW